MTSSRSIKCGGFNSAKDARGVGREQSVWPWTLNDGQADEGDREEGARGPQARQCSARAQAACGGSGRQICAVIAAQCLSVRIATIIWQTRAQAFQGQVCRRRSRRRRGGRLVEMRARREFAREKGVGWDGLEFLRSGSADLAPAVSLRH